jgi:acyl-coenzyme A synthetase/AMP-(fatty) acid ligase
MFFDNLKYRDSAIAIDEFGGALMHDELFFLIHQLQQIIDKKDLVFCLCENSLGALAGYVSFIESGLIPIMLDTKKEQNLILNLRRIYSPKYFWIPKENIGIFTETEEVLCLNNYSLLRSLTRCNEQRINEKLALLLTTSGSTGSPKLVRLSYSNILSNAKSIAEYLNITDQERPITSLPMYYSYGLSVINSHLISGATILLTNRAVIQKEFWAFAREQKATSIAGVPYTYEMLKRLRVFQMDLPHLKLMTQAGGKLNADIAKEYVEQAKEAGKQFIIMYGQTEATARMSYLPWINAKDKYDSIGVAIPGGEFSLQDINGVQITEPDVDGELVYKGPNVSMGYAECREDLQKDDENRGILYTGDIARRDIDGFYYITGRMKRFVKVYGNRVNLDAVEQLIKPLVLSCACIGVDDKITVFLTDKDVEEDVKSLLIKKTGLNPRAFAFQVIDRIPQNSSGKTQYAELSKRLI